MLDHGAAVKIANREISKLKRPFLVAEAGDGHQGQPELALQMARIAVESGADALTFQEIDEKFLYTDLGSLPVPHQECVGWECLEECREVAKAADLCFSVCVTDSSSLKRAIDVGIDFIKIVSYDLTFIPFLEECGQSGLPIFMSTGASLFDEVERAIEALDASDRLVLYHTDCGYPTADDNVGLNRMLRLRERFGLPAGYCDHTDHGLSCIAASALGAAVIEKHFTVDRSIGGSDHMVAFDPEQITQLFTDIKRIAVILGDGNDQIHPADLYRRDNLRRSVALRRAVSEGEKIREDLLTMLRPSGGLAWAERRSVVGKVACRDLPFRHQITLDDVV